MSDKNYQENIFICNNIEGEHFSLQYIRRTFFLATARKTVDINELKMLRKTK